jgi:hypothetical protein
MPAAHRAGGNVVGRSSAQLGAVCASESAEAKGNRIRATGQRRPNKGFRNINMLVTSLHGKHD